MISFGKSLHLIFHAGFEFSQRLKQMLSGQHILNFPRAIRSSKSNEHSSLCWLPVMPTIFVELVEFNKSTDRVQVEYDEDMTVDRLASHAMNLCEKGFVHCAVRVTREFLALESKVKDIDLSSGIIYVYQVNCYGGESIVAKIQDKPTTIYLESLCFLNTGFYPAFEKLTVLQYLTLLEDTAGNICYGEPRENYWILKDGEPVNLNVREHRSKLVRTMLPNLKVIVATEA